MMYAGELSVRWLGVQIWYVKHLHCTQVIGRAAEVCLHGSECCNCGIIVHSLVKALLGKHVQHSCQQNSQLQYTNSLAFSPLRDTTS